MMLKPSDCKNMNDIRNAIDRIDESIVELIAKRSLYVLKASEFKKSEKAVKDSKRVKEVIETKKELAKKYNVSSTLIETIYEKMIEHFIKEEIQEWEQKGKK